MAGRRVVFSTRRGSPRFAKGSPATTTHLKGRKRVRECVCERERDKSVLDRERACVCVIERGREPRFAKGSPATTTHLLPHPIVRASGCNIFRSNCYDAVGAGATTTHLPTFRY